MSTVWVQISPPSCKSGEVRERTIKNYKGFQTQFDEFQQETHRKYNFEDITIDFYDQYVQFFNKKNYSLNTIGRHIKNLKTIMKFSKEDISLIRWNILAICASLLVSMLAIYSSGEYADKSQKNLRNAQRQLADARNRLNAAKDDQVNMAIYADEYGVLLERKIVGDNQRLDWMEGLVKIHTQNLAVDFRYNIAPQKIYAPQPALDSGNFDINYSETKLQIDPLLFKWFGNIEIRFSDAQIDGVFHLGGEVEDSSHS